MFEKNRTELITGNQAVVRGALAAGAEFFAGYPITPATEILEEWAEISSAESLENPRRQPRLRFIQAEDETSAGFNIIGAILAGKRAFTATAGPGNILMQDPIAMAEAMRLPFVGIIMQRGGPSTGTVIYSQQEVTLTCYGGNGEGLRIVYSTASPQELYDYTIKAFNTAWQYRFPTFLLGDGYQSKQQSAVKIHSRQSAFSSASIRVVAKGNLRNCYNFEEQLAEVLDKDIAEYNRLAPKIAEYEEYLCRDAKMAIVCHGIVSRVVKEAVDILREHHHKKVGMFRPITLRPFPNSAASHLASRVEKILIVESAEGQLARIVKDHLYGLTRIETYYRPAMPISVEEIVKIISN